MLEYIGIGLTLSNIILMVIIDPIFILIPIIIFALIKFKVLNTNIDIILILILILLLDNTYDKDKWLS